MSADPGYPPRSTSSTRRCATAPSSRASRSPSRTSCASPSSSTGSASAGSRAATRRPTRRTRSSSGGPPPSWTWRRPRSWPSARPAAARPGRRRPDAAGAGRRGVTTSCIVGKSWDFHVTEALRTTLDEGVAMVADSVRFLRAEGLRVFFDAEHFFDGYKANPEFALRVLEAAATEGAECWCCATPTAARCPTRCSGSSARSPPTSGRPADRHPHPERHRLRGGQLGRRRRRRRHPGPGHGQRLRRAHRQRQPHDGHPGPQAQAGHPLPARGSPRAAHRGEPARRRAGEPAAARRRPLRRARRPSPTRAGCTPRRWAGPAAPPTSTSTPPSSATTPGCSCPTWAAGPAWR